MKKMSQFLKTTEGQFIGSVALIVALLMAYYAFAVPTQQAGEPVEIAISATDHVKGAKDGKVTLVEFGDFQCPACAAYEPIVRQVLEDNKNIVKFTYRHFPLTQIHKNALLAAKATEAAALQGKFWEMHDILYSKQGEWGNSLNARDFMMTYATTIGVSVEKFAADLESKSIEEKILAEYREGVRLGVQGTPTFFINGKKMEGPKDLASFNKLIKEAAEAK
jgi:protein-disulfide isomerase